VLYILLSETRLLQLWNEKLYQSRKKKQNACNWIISFVLKQKLTWWSNQ
jgi:hypothetical protein